MYRTTCRSCGGQLHVVSGRFRTTKMPLEPNGFAFADATQLETEDEQVWCSRCEAEGPLGDCTVACPDCLDAGWTHGESVERCDSCKKLSNDDAAKAAHTAQCGCGCGERWAKQLYKVTVGVLVAAPPDEDDVVKKVVNELVDHNLSGLVTDLPDSGLMQVCSAEAVTVGVEEHHPSRKTLVELDVLDGEEGSP
jgi:hypothetical protein